MDMGEVYSYPEVSIEVVNDTKNNIFRVHVGFSYMNEEGQIIRSVMYGVLGLSVMETKYGPRWN